MIHELITEEVELISIRSGALLKQASLVVSIADKNLIIHRKIHGMIRRDRGPTRHIHIMMKIPVDSIFLMEEFVVL
jgi:hypothetical protein